MHAPHRGFESMHSYEQLSNSVSRNTTNKRLPYNLKLFAPCPHIERKRKNHFYNMKGGVGMPRRERANKSYTKTGKAHAK